MLMKPKPKLKTERTKYSPLSSKLASRNSHSSRPTNSWPGLRQSDSREKKKKRSDAWLKS